MCHVTNYSKTSVCSSFTQHVMYFTFNTASNSGSILPSTSFSGAHASSSEECRWGLTCMLSILYLKRTHPKKKISVFMWLDHWRNSMIVKCFLFVCLRRDERFNRPCSCIIAAKKKNIKGQKKASEIMLYSLWFKTNLMEASRYQKLSRLSRPLNHLFCV